MSSVLEGQGISWLKHSRVKKLLEDENYRNFVVSRLNKNLDKKLTEDDHHIEDVVCVTSDLHYYVTRAMKKICLKVRHKPGCKTIEDG